MLEGIRRRREQCPACGKPAAGDGDCCIFCGAGLLLLPVNGWRSVYHPYSYADALLASATLQAHGLTARLKHSNVERALLGHVGSVVEVAEGDHLFAQELLRQLRGVRTDTEYLEWQQLKHAARRRRRVLIGAVAAATASAAIAVGVVWNWVTEENSRSEAAQERSEARG